MVPSCRSKNYFQSGTTIVEGKIKSVLKNLRRRVCRKNDKGEIKLISPVEKNDFLFKIKKLYNLDLNKCHILRSEF